MRYQVPQFIEVEDKIFGPLTIKQFVYIVGALGFSYMAVHFLPSYISSVIALAFLTFGALLAFYKINNKPFINIVEASALYFFGSKLYIWRKSEPKIEHKAADIVAASQMYVPKLSDSKLKDLAWSLDINEKINKTIYSKDAKDLLPRTMREEMKG
jgi:hypothetical protein